MATRKISRASRRQSPSSSHSRPASRKPQAEGHGRAILALVRARAAAAVVAGASDVNMRIVMVESVLQPLTEALAQLDPKEAAGYEEALVCTTHPKASLAHGIEMAQVTAVVKEAQR
jgi:hypothetical protein